MSEPEVALVFSPETWVEELHRYLTDHGGARVRQVVVEPALALEETYGVLVVSHRWPALTRPFVDAVHARGRRVLGVFEPAEPAGQEHLLALGADEVIGSDAPMAEIVDAILALDPGDLTAHGTGSSARFDGDDDPGPGAPHRAEGSAPGALTVVGGPPGSGATEVAIELACLAGGPDQRAVLVDADEVVPAIAQRLSLPIEPNLRTAVDAVEFGLGDLSSALVPVAGAEVDAVCGLPNVAAWGQVRSSEVLDVLGALRGRGGDVVVDVSSHLEDLAAGPTGGRFAITRAAVGAADAVVATGLGSPVGVTRLLAWVADARTVNPGAPVHLVINRCPADGFRRSEIDEEVTRTFAPASLTFVPHDPRVDAAAWAGTPVGKGLFTKALAKAAAGVLAPTVEPVPRPTRRRRPLRKRVALVVR